MNLGKGLNSSHFKRVISFFKVSKFTLNLDTLTRFLYFLNFSFFAFSLFLSLFICGIFCFSKSLNLCLWVLLNLCFSVVYLLRVKPKWQDEPSLRDLTKSNRGNPRIQSNFCHKTKHKTLNLSYRFVLSYWAQAKYPQIWSVDCTFKVWIFRFLAKAQNDKRRAVIASRFHKNKAWKFTNLSIANKGFLKDFRWI